MKPAITKWLKHAPITAIIRLEIARKTTLATVLQSARVHITAHVIKTTGAILQTDIMHLRTLVWLTHVKRVIKHAKN